MEYVEHALGLSTYSGGKNDESEKLNIYVQNIKTKFQKDNISRKIFTVMVMVKS